MIDRHPVEVQRQMPFLQRSTNPHPLNELEKWVVFFTQTRQIRELAATLTASCLLILSGMSFQLVKFFKEHCVFIRRRQDESLPHAEMG